MESFRKVIKGWLGKVLLILFLTPLALVGIEGYFSGGNKADVVKSVNGQEISKKELENVVKNYKDQYLPMVQGDEALLNMSVIEQKALDTLISRNLLIQQAEKLGISLSEDQIAQMIAQQPNFQENGQFSQKLYENYLRAEGITNPMLINLLRQDHALKMLTSSILDNVLINQLDVQQIANLQTEKRTLHLASVQLDGYKQGLTATNQEISDYYNLHKSKFTQVENVDVDYVVISPTMLPKAAPVTDAELEQAYANFVENAQNNAKQTVKHILIMTSDTRNEMAAQKLANEIYGKIQNGLSFTEAAAQFSDDTTSKNKGGLVEAYAPGLFSADFDQAVSSLKTGEASKPIKTQYGYHIIEVEKESVQVPSFESEKPRLVAEIEKNKTTNQFSDLVNRLNEDVVGNDALDVVTEQLKTSKIESLKGVSLTNQHPYFSQPNVKAQLFNTDVKNGDRNVSSSIQLANGETIWVKVREYYPAGVMPLAKVSTQVKAKVIEQKAYQQALKKVEGMLVQFKKQPASQVVASSSDIKFEDIGIFSRSQGLKRPIERAAFSLAAPKDGMWSVTTTQLPNELVIVGVSQVDSSAVSHLSPEEVQSLNKLYEQLRGQQMLKNYTEYLKSQAKIK